MGNDGGSIPKRRELVKEAAREKTTSEAKETLQEQLEYCWTTCPLSQQPLKEPVVSDWAGNLYNKDAVIQYLLPAEDAADRATKTDQASLLGGRIKSLKDVQEVKFHLDESLRDRASGAHFERRWSCPITRKTLGPGVKAVYLVPCGHAFEKAAVKNVTEGRCLTCEEPFEQDNVIIILPSTAKERERLVLRSQKLAEKALSHTLRKAGGKKRKKDAAATSSDVHQAPKTSSTDKADAVLSKTKSAAEGIRNSSTASLTAKVQAELDAKSKRRRIDENIQGLYSKNDRAPVKDGDFMTRGFTM